MNGGPMYRISPEGRLNPRGAPPNNTNTNTYRNRRDGDQTVVGGGEVEQHRVFVCFGKWFEFRVSRHAVPPTSEVADLWCSYSAHPTVTLAPGPPALAGGALRQYPLAR